jgi:hypothetical protein
MPSILKLYDPGALGINADANPVALDDRELTKAQNTIRDVLGSARGLRKRPGLDVFNTTTLTNSVLGGIGVPLIDQSSNGVTFIYIGRYPTS